MAKTNPNQMLLNGEQDVTSPAGKRARKKPLDTDTAPKNVGKAVKVSVPDFSDPNRPKSCLEVDFPIAPINALSALEGNAGKPIYQMSKWWARRRSCIFRAMLIAAGTEAPRRPDGTVDELAAARLVWDLYYANHQKAGNFKHLKVLDIFMGGGTTLVEGSRLGYQVAGVDLNPVAWFVVKNELACTDPEQVKRFFDYIEAQVKPLIQPFYVTDCPRGHKGRWYRVNSTPSQVRAGSGSAASRGEPMPANFDPCELPPEERRHYTYEGPEVIYTFWSKHGPCPAQGCGHRTPIFSSPVIATKTISIKSHKVQCHHCRKRFDWDLADPRMAPAEPLVVSPDEPIYICPDRGETRASCPHCGKPVKRPDDKPVSKKVELTLLMHPDWLKGAPGEDDAGPLGGAVDLAAEENARWYRLRRKHLSYIEIRGPLLEQVGDPRHAGRAIETGKGTVPGKSSFVCGSCGRKHDALEAVTTSTKREIVVPYVIQGHCPKCDDAGHPYNGRFFKAPSTTDIERFVAAEREWSTRRESDLRAYWPREELPYAYMTHHANGNLKNRGYSHWWKMFNARQLLIHSQIVKAVAVSDEADWPRDVQEQALGCLQQYLRNQNMFCFWNMQRDTPEPMFSNANYHPKAQVVESNFAHTLGRGNWTSSSEGVIEGLTWDREPWELAVAPRDSATKTVKYPVGDPVHNGSAMLVCASSTELESSSGTADLVITDPPFGGNLFYADLADFFYVWLRIPLRRWYPDYFTAPFTNKSQECITNRAERPDTPDETDVDDISVADRFYKDCLTQCWAEAYRVMKPGGLLAFTFHHSVDEPWVGVLESLFDAGFILEATYPIRSDETKGEYASFGSKKIEYDIIHVCRKRLEAPTPVSWAKMRRWVRDEMARLRNLLELYRRDLLPEADIRVILRGKALEFYSRHYGQVFKGTDEPISVREALLGINQLLDEDLANGAQARRLPPAEAEPLSRLYLQLFAERSEMARDELHKLLRGTGVTQKDFEEREWVREHAKVIYAVPVPERFEQLRKPGRRRDSIKTDLDQACFLTGSALPSSGVSVLEELTSRPSWLKAGVVPILRWLAETDQDTAVRDAARRAGELVERWKAEQATKPRERTLFDELSE